MDITFFIFLLFGLQALYWVIGRRSSKNLKGKEDYFLAGKSVSFFPLLMTFLATQVGGGLVLGAAEEAYRYGWPVLLYPLGASLGLIGLGLGLGKKLAKFPVSTVAQILELVYRSPFLKKVASTLSVISLFMILVGQIIASRKFLLTLGFSSTPLFIFFWAIIIAYTVKGGLKAVISTDIAQAFVFSLVFFFSFAFVAWSSDWSAPMVVEPFASSSSKWVGWLLMPLLFMTIEQDMGQRCFAGDSPKTVSRATFAAGVLTLLICCIPVFLGVFAKKMGVIPSEGASILMVAINAFTNPWISAVVGCAVIAAIISTATSLINAISSNLSQDFFREKEGVAFMQFLTALMSIGAILFAFLFNNVVDVLIQSYELSLSCLFVPIFIALFRPQGNFISALLAIFIGLCSFCFFRFVASPFPSEIISISLSFLGFCAGEIWVWSRKKRAAVETQM